MNYISDVITEMSRWFNMFNEKYFENKLPDAIITVQKAKSNNYGHFTLDKVWKSMDDESYEINIAAHSLQRNVEDIAGTILHECLHCYHKINDIKDFSGKIHNRKFKLAAEKLGFIVTQSKQCGWGHTEIDGDLKEFIINDIKPNAEIFKYARIVSVEKPKKEKKKIMFKYICPQCELECKAKENVLIKCSHCDVDMEMED